MAVRETATHRQCFMTWAYLECSSGLSGDMFLAALVDAGCPLEQIAAVLAPLAATGLTLRAEKVLDHGLAATQLHIDIPADHHHRSWTEMVSLIKGLHLTPALEERSLSAMERIARVEAAIHQKDLAELHFHEVGAIDTIVDVVGVMYALEQLGISQLTASVVETGTGKVEFSHGVYPVPAPATLAILVEAGIPFSAQEPGGELLTPTGAALLAELVSDYGPAPALTVQKVAHGAGSKRREKAPNVVRLWLGEPLSGISTDRVIGLETNLDDLSPEITAYALEKLLAAGALDVYLTPVVMKKNRPGVILSVLARPADEAALTQLILMETSTLGVRRTEYRRTILERESSTVETAFGPIRVKRSLGAGGKYAPEYEDCRQAAEKYQVPLWKVYQEVYHHGGK